MLQAKIALLFVFLTWFPGYWVLRCLKVRTEGSLPQLVFLPPVFGLPVISLLYFGFRVFHAEVFFIWVPVSILAGSAIFFRYSGFSFSVLQEARTSWRPLAFFLIAFGVFMLLFSSYAHRIYHDNAGGFVIGDNAFDDHIWGVSVTAELQHRVPPMLPIFSGYKLQYHYVADLFVELLYRLSGTQMRMLEFYYKMISPVQIFWLFGVLLLALQNFFKRFGLTVLAFLLLVFLPPQTSFLYKQHYTLTVLYFYAAVFFFLPLYFPKKDPSMGRAAFFVLGVLPLYDSIIGGVTLGAIILYVSLDAIVTRKLSPVLKYCFGACLMCGLCMTALLGGQHGHTSSFALGNGVLLKTALIRFRNLDRFINLAFHFATPVSSLLSEMLRSCVLAFSRFMTFLITLFFPLAESPVGYHFLAFPAVWAALRRPEKGKEINTIVSWSLVLSFCVSTFLIYKPDGPATSVLDRAFCFLSVSLMPLTVLAIARLWSSRRIWMKALLIGMAMVYLILPVVRGGANPFKPRFYAYINRDAMEVFDYIRDRTDPNAVILHPFHDNPIYRNGEPPITPAWLFEGHYFFMSAVGERQTVFEGAVTSTTYFMGDLTYADAVRRLGEVDRFYQTEDAAWARDFLKRFKINYVWMPRNKPLRFQSGGFLSPVLQNDANVLYAVSYA